MAYLGCLGGDWSVLLISFWFLLVELVVICFWLWLPLCVFASAAVSLATLGGNVRGCAESRALCYSVIYMWWRVVDGGLHKVVGR